MSLRTENIWKQNRGRTRPILVYGIVRLVFSSWVRVCQEKWGEVFPTCWQERRDETRRDMMDESDGTTFCRDTRRVLSIYPKASFTYQRRNRGGSKIVSLSILSILISGIVQFWTCGKVSKESALTLLQDSQYPTQSTGETTISINSIYMPAN